jgi:UDP-4-amino-4,6-dideoxy-N-acetyl-beta-L-altrosamine N-acetyltransferase
MIIRKYGIVLRRLKEGDIELVRQMRNSVEIRQYMFYRDEITSEMQKKWFLSINNVYNYYFIIEVNGKKIGLIHGKNNDFEKGTCEGGIFIWDKAYMGTSIPSLASIILNDFTFYTVHSLNTVYAKVVQGNKTALKYNRFMGYEPCSPLNADKDIQWMRLTAENYSKRIKTLRKGIESLTGDSSPLSLEEIDFSDDSAEDIRILYSNLPKALQGLKSRIIQSGHQV